VPDARDARSPHWHGRGQSATYPAVELVTDLLVPDVMWYTMLSSGHLQRLGGPPDGAVELPGGRVELTIGDPEQWIPGHPDLVTVRARGASLLGPCLATADETFQLARERMPLIRGQQPRR